MKKPLNIFMILKCGQQDSYYFMNQITNLEMVKKLYVFRDAESYYNDKIKYYVVPKFLNGSLKQLIRFFQTLFFFYKKPDYIIGIYEIPHGLIAVIIGMILRKKTIVSIIGNPGYLKIRHGLWLRVMLFVCKKATFVTVTGSVSKSILTNFGIDSNKIRILPNSLNFQVFDNVIRNEKFDLISLGRLSPEKKVINFVQIVNLLRKSNPFIKTAIAGSGQCMSDLMKLIKDLELENNIVLLGYIPDNELPSFFASGKIFLLNSETEGFPRTILQSALCGTPVITSAVGDISDVIQNGYNGYIIADYNDLNSYVNQVQLLLDNKALRERLSHNLNMSVREKFSIEAASKVWEEMLVRI